MRGFFATAFSTALRDTAIVLASVLIIDGGLSMADSLYFAFNKPRADRIKESRNRLQQESLRRPDT